MTRAQILAAWNSAYLYGKQITFSDSYWRCLEAVVQAARQEAINDMFTVAKLAGSLSAKRKRRTKR